MPHLARDGRGVRPAMREDKFHRPCIIEAKRGRSVNARLRVRQLPGPVCDLPDAGAHSRDPGARKAWGNERLTQELGWSAVGVLVRSGAVRGQRVGRGTGCWPKKRMNSAPALGPGGSVEEPCRTPPDQA